MMNKMKKGPSDFYRQFKFEYKITLIYLVFGFLWILFSDKVLDMLEPDDRLLTELQTFKGSFFIVVTSGLLFLLVKRHMQKLKTAEYQRIESEFRFTKLWENGPFGLVMVSKELQFKNVNPEFCRMLGYSKDELLKLTFKDISHPEDLVKDLPNIKMLINKEISVYKTEKRYVCKDGQVIWGALSVFPNYDNEGRFLYNLAIVEDINRRKLAEEALRERENKLSTIFNILPVGISILDQDHKVVYENQALENILGITKEGIEHGDYQNRKYLRSDGSLKPAEEFASSLVYSMKTAQYNLITGVIREDGKTIWTNVSAVPVEFPDWKVVLVTSDITRQKLIENELKESEEYLKLGYETANLGIWKNNLETMTVEFDERARNHYGFHESVVNISDVIARIHPDDKERLEGEIEKATSISGSGKFLTEYRVIHPDGKVHWLYIGVRVIFEGEGENRRSIMGYGTSLDITEHKQEEDALKKLEYILSEGQKIAHIGTFEYIIDTQSTYWSAEEYSIYGLDPSGPSPSYEVMLAKCIHPDDAAILNQSFGAAIQSQSLYELEHRIIKPDGSIRWVFDRAHPYFDQNGKLVRYVGTTLDITEQKESEEKIRENLNLLRIAGEKARLGGWNVILGENKARWSDEVAAIHEMPSGYSPLVEEGMSFYAPEWREKIVDVFSRCAEEGIPYDEEMEIITSSGKRIWVRTIGDAVRDENGKIFKVQGAFQDITERKKAEEVIRKSHEQLKNILLTSPGIVCSAHLRSDDSVCFPFGGERLAEYFGIPEAHLDRDSTPYIALIHPDDNENVFASIMESAKKLTPWRCEWRMVHPSKGVLWIEGHSMPIRETDGTTLWHGVITDITERKRSEDKIRMLNEKLEQRVIERTSQLEAANKELEAFSYSVSHDLRSPLRHINGFAEILLEDHSADLPVDARKHLTTITGAAKKMGALIDDLLSFSRAGRAELKKSNFTMNKVIEDVLSQINPSVINRKIEWKISRLPDIYGDYNLLRQVWANLMENAVKYTCTREKAVIEIAYTESDKETVFHIKDNGVGFDMAYADKLFGVFQRLHSSSEFDGTGIGLANVKRIISRHGGKTWADAEPDKGASFFFSIPK